MYIQRSWGTDANREGIQIREQPWSFFGVHSRTADTKGVAAKSADPTSPNCTNVHFITLESPDHAGERRRGGGVQTLGHAARQKCLATSLNGVAHGFGPEGRISGVRHG